MSAPAAPEAAEPREPASPLPPPPGRRSPFPLEGRAAPGLHLAGWLLTIAGGVTAFVGALAGGGLGAGFLFGIGMLLAALGLGAASSAQALRRRADGTAGYAGPSPLLVFPAVVAGTYAVGTALGLLLPPLAPQVDVLLSALVLGSIGIGALAVLVVGSGALSWRDIGFRLPATVEGGLIGDVARGIALGVPTLFVGSGLAAGLVGLLGATPAPTLPLTLDPAGALLNLLAAVVVAPIWEETFFRGYATTAWAAALGSRAAIVRGALFFAVIHVLTISAGSFDEGIRVALIGFAARLPVGLVLGWVFLRRRSLAAPVALHATYNALPLLLYLALGSPVQPG